MSFIGNIVGVAAESIRSEIKDQYLECFTTDTLGQDILVKRAHRNNTDGRNKGSGEIISSGSKVIVPEGTYALMIDGGKIIDSITEPGLYTWDDSSSGSVLGGGGKSVLGDVFDRFRFAGEVPKSQRIYYVNALEIMNQTVDEVLNIVYPDPFYGNVYFDYKVVFSFRITDPAKFFRKTGKETTVYDYMGSSSSPKMPIMELVDHMGEALNLCGTRDKISFAQLLSHKSTVKKTVNEVLSEFWQEQRGMTVESIAIADITLDEESKARVETFDNAKIFADDPAALNALVALGLTEAMQLAAANTGGTMLANCPFCGVMLTNGNSLHNCPACNADISTYHK
ncbi:MAG: SPFH domain-containing protein [Saccharofermentans sp.]|nr:SPFH domain-containing protein [Saccharofermentans sp.]